MADRGARIYELQHFSHAELCVHGFRELISRRLTLKMRFGLLCCELGRENVRMHLGDRCWLKRKREEEEVKIELACFFSSWLQKQADLVE